ncbi:MAG TPA: plastocyanin/azurin family copper-binding protein [Candidatus Limnocylindrales bacterium]|nr:plastocyanin/azurin family copper-binding protein [Candidatus Limnocylindrales bacterium]
MRTLTTAAVGVMLTLALAACGGTGATAAPVSEAPASQAPASEAPPASEGAGGAACEVVEEAGTVQAQAAEFAFSPDPVTASVGDAITWTNADSAPHTVTLDDGSCDTGQFGRGEAGTLRFNAPGTYAYHCALHPNMKGTVEVG